MISASLSAQGPAPCLPQDLLVLGCPSWPGWMGVCNAACLDIEHKIPCSKKNAEKIAETLGKELKQEVAG